MTTAWDLMDATVAQLWSYAPDVSPAEAADAGAVIARVASIIARLSTMTIERGDLRPIAAALRPPAQLVQSLTTLDLPQGRATELVSGLGDVLMLTTPDTRWHSVAAAGLLADVAYAAAEVVALAPPAAGPDNLSDALRETRSLLDAVPAGPPTDHPRAAWMHRQFTPPPALGPVGTTASALRAVTDAISVRTEERSLTSIDLKHAVRAGLDVMHHGRTTPGVLPGEDAHHMFATAKAWHDLLVVMDPMTDGFPTLDASLVAPVEDLRSSLRGMDAAGFAEAAGQLPALAATVQSAITTQTEHPGHLPRLLAPINDQHWAMIKLHDRSAHNAPRPYAELTFRGRQRLMQAGSTAVFAAEDLAARLRPPAPVSPPIAPGGPRPARPKPPRVLANKLGNTLGTSRLAPLPFAPAPPAPVPPAIEM